MADGKVRLVRCPKCANVLPELPDYSVYQCGGCGAVLRAKFKNPEVDILAGKSDGERGGEGIEKFDKFPEEGVVNQSSVVSETNIKLNDSSSLRCEQRFSEYDDVRYKDEKCGNVSNFTVDKWVVGNDLEMIMKRDMATEVVELKSRVENSSGSQKSGAINDTRIGERVRIEEFQKTLRTDVENLRFSTSNHLDEESSKSQFCSEYAYSTDARNRVECLKQDRVKLLRKLDELKDQLSQSCNAVEKQKEKVPQDRRMLHRESCGPVGTWFPDGSLGLNRASVQLSAPDKNVTEPPYFSQYHEPHPFMNRPPDMAARGFYSTMRTSNHVPVYGDPYGSQMLKRDPPPIRCHYQQPSSHMCFPGQYMDADFDPCAPYRRNETLHQSSCSCFRCYGEHVEIPGPVPPTVFHNKKFPDDVPNNPMFYHHEKPGAFGYNSRCANNPLNSRKPYVKYSTGINCDMHCFSRCRPQMAVASTTGRLCHPMAGGAPFITCLYCFKLLQLPMKVLLMEKNKHKVQCGACSEIIILATVNKKFVITSQADTKQAPSNVDDGSDEVVEASYSHGHMNRSGINFISDDSSYEFQTTDGEPVSSSTGQAFDLGQSPDIQIINSSPLSTSGDEDFLDGLIAPRETTNCTDLLVKAISSPRLPSSPLQENFDYSSNDRVVNRFGKGNQSTRSDEEKIIPKKTTSRQNSFKDVPLATEMEVPFNEYLNIGTYQGSAEVNREDQSRIIKKRESFFAGIIKKSFKDFPRSNQAVERGKSNITVNGHPIPDCVVKKAEQLAGSIHPGQYWYDSRAGFWGVMGRPCLGIIPPFIEEFNYPMPENCAGGSTEIFVNGRELHKKDLDLLASRGLPTQRDRSYVIEISGRVWDEDSGEKLNSLGKLAPTVEKLSRGFGMKAPRAA